MYRIDRFSSKKLQFETASSLTRQSGMAKRRNEIVKKQMLTTVTAIRRVPLFFNDSSSNKYIKCVYCLRILPFYSSYRKVFFRSKLFDIFNFKLGNDVFLTKGSRHFHMNISNFIKVPSTNYFLCTLKDKKKK